MENKQSHGYEPVGYVDTLEEAQRIRGEGGFYTEKDIYAARYMHDGKIWKYIFKEIKPFKP